MPSIKIIATPPGQAPEWVRKEWVGIMIPLSVQVPGKAMGVLGGIAEYPDGYQVEAIDAFVALAKKSPEAAKWWEQNAPWVALSRLIFAQHVCELIV